jgi:hypothetical protein
VGFIAVYDACVLYPSTLRDLLIRLHQTGLVQAKWTGQILDEVERNLRTNLPDVPDDKLRRLRSLMIAAVRDCMVTDYEALIDAVVLPDPDDRHVVAAAIRVRAPVIVTDNLRDFPASALAPWDIEARSADDFVLDQISLDRQAVYGEIVRIADSHNSPPESVDDVLRRLERCGLVRSVAALST